MMEHDHKMGVTSCSIDFTAYCNAQLNSCHKIPGLDTQTILPFSDASPN